MANDSNNSQETKVIPIKRKNETIKESERKWGKEAMRLRFCIVPSLLFKAQRRLGINATQLAIIMHLADFWWEKDRRPWPSKKLLAERMGLGPRQIQRHMEALETAGLVKRKKRKGAHGGLLTNEYDLSGLVKRLNELAPEFLEVEEEARVTRRQVAKPGGRKAQTPRKAKQ